MWCVFIGPGSYQERPPHYNHMDGNGQPSYDQEPPGQYFDDRMGPPMNGQPSMDDYPDNGPRTPSVQDGSKYIKLDRCNVKHILTCRCVKIVIQTYSVLFWSLFFDTAAKKNLFKLFCFEIEFQRVLYAALWDLKKVSENCFWLGTEIQRLFKNLWLFAYNNQAQFLQSV